MNYSVVPVEVSDANSLTAVGVSAEIRLQSHATAGPVFVSSADISAPCNLCDSLKYFFNGLRRHNWIQCSASYSNICELQGLRLCRRVALFKKNLL